MKTYLLTSSFFAGHVAFTYDDDLVLLKYDLTEATLESNQRDFFTRRLPKTFPELQAILKTSKGAKLSLQKQTEVTFQMFWDRYNEKARSSKKKAETTWRRMSQIQRDKAYNFIEVYERNIPPGIAKKYAETYLNAELWNN